jgi:SAM-dependent methyltransferase
MCTSLPIGNPDCHPAYASPASEVPLGGQAAGASKEASMETSFGKQFWETHWQRAEAHGAGVPVNPHLVREVAGLQPGTALDAGCGEGAEAIWLAEHDWQVTAVDISAAALARAATRASAHPVAATRLQWLEADLSAWEPSRRFDLVATLYAHPAMAQLEFYRRIADWVAPGGTLLIVGHRDHGEHGAGPRQEHEGTTVTAAGVAAVLEPTQWEVVSADEVSRHATRRSGDTVVIDDVVVRARRSGVPA